MDNMIQACPKCNQAKSDKDTFEWYGEARKYEIPRIVLGKYLKLVFDFHEKKETLDLAAIKNLLPMLIAKTEAGTSAVRLVGLSLSGF